MHKAVEHILKLGKELHFVQNNIVGVLVNDPLFYIFQHIVGIAQFFVTAVIQGDLDDMVFPNALFQQIIMEQVEQKV